MRDRPFPIRLKVGSEAKTPVENTHIHTLKNLPQRKDFVCPLLLSLDIIEMWLHGVLPPEQGLTRGHRPLPGLIKLLRCDER